jgi:predicted SAM-dependent methyltransferase
MRRIRRESWGRPARINLGSGTHVKKGFLNVDILPGGDLTLDLRCGMPFESECCEMILSEHFFEHLEYPEPVTSLFRECRRVLRPGGVLRFSIPDTEWPLTEYAHGDDASYFRTCRELHWHPPTCTTRLEHINYHFRQDGEHRFAYDEETAVKALAAAGFEEVRRDAYDPVVDSPHREVGSLFMWARRS